MRKAFTALENGDFRDAAIAFEKLEGHGSSEYYLETIYSQLPQYKLINAEVGDLVTFGYFLVTPCAPSEGNHRKSWLVYI